jgi:hypothetical protein
MGNAETPNATTDTRDNSRSWAKGGDLDRRDPDTEPKLQGRSGGGDSGGGAYPNPHTGKEGEGESREGWMGHGGETGQSYYGTGRLGGKDVGGNANAPSEEGDED